MFSSPYHSSLEALRIIYVLIGLLVTWQHLPDWKVFKILPEFIHEPIKIKVKVLVKMFCLLFNEAVKLYISLDYWLNTTSAALC